MTISQTTNLPRSTGDFPGTVSYVQAGSVIRRTDDIRPGADYVINVDALHDMLGQQNLQIVDVRLPEQCPDGHIPGAVQLDYNKLVRRSGTTEGLLPSPGDLSSLFGSIGLEPDQFVVAYDDGAGVDAARLLWTLEVAGHKNHALLNGGFAAWDDAEYEVSESPWLPRNTCYPVSNFNNSVVQLEDVLESIGRQDVCIVDTRGAAEFSGEDIRTKKGPRCPLRVGHIPGAIHFDWASAVDMTEEGALRDPYTLQIELQSLGITKDKEIIVYCQSNRRSSHTFLVLKWLGYPNVRAYTGSWSEWGNDANTPVEI